MIDAIISLVPNTLVAISNFSFLYFMKNKKNINSLLYLPMIASVIYHLAETKHKLPGFPILNKYAYHLLNLDRLCAIGAGSFIISRLYNFPYLLSYKLVLIGIVGFVGLAYSEKSTIAKNIFNNNDINISYTEFTISHIIWHLCAFKSLAMVI
jgi:hypothetical protein